MTVYTYASITETIDAVIRENLASAVVEEQRNPGLAHAFRMNARGAFHAWDRLTHPEEQPVWFADRKRLEALVYPQEPVEG